MSSDAFNTDSQPSASMGASVAIFLAGATVGAIAALLLAPQAGRESRKQLSDYGRRTGETLSQWATATCDLFPTAENVHGQKANGKYREREETVHQAVDH